ncbi:MAG: hypothetical protein Q4G05_05955 [Clostridia bacterium]|nr:hypothetical protein [Clostridia bacterium]
MSIRTKKVIRESQVKHIVLGLFIEARTTKDSKRKLDIYNKMLLIYGKEKRDELIKYIQSLLDNKEDIKSRDVAIMKNILPSLDNRLESVYEKYLENEKNLYGESSNNNLLQELIKYREKGIKFNQFPSLYAEYIAGNIRRKKQTEITCERDYNYLVKLNKEEIIKNLKFVN